MYIRAKWSTKAMHGCQEHASLGDELQMSKATATMQHMHIDASAYLSATARRCAVLHNSNHDGGRDQNLQLLLKNRNPHHDHVFKIIDQSYYVN